MKKRANKELVELLDSWIRNWDIKYTQINIDILNNKLKYIKITEGFTREEALEESKRNEK